ncbi:MAG: ATP-dependent helicase, partial [candidate division WOR-3 bacterium]
DDLEEVSLRSDIDDRNESRERVNLMTLHNAKGLEFDTVFITGMEDGLIPHYKCQDDQKQYEEERRLLYVGITRARKKLYMTYARQRDMFRAGPSLTEISPFLNEIPHDLISGDDDSD